MLRAAAFVRGHGGVPASRVFTRIWLAIVGLWSWDDLPVLPPEFVLLPGRFPLALQHWGCWARQTIVPLAIVSALRPSSRSPSAWRSWPLHLPQPPAPQLSTASTGSSSASTRCCTGTSGVR